MSHRRQPSHFLSCFQPATDNEVPPPPPLRIPSHPNLTTSLYRTHSALFGLTWSRDHLFARSLHIHIHLNQQGGGGGLLSNKPSFHLQIKPWKKRGSQRLRVPTGVAADVYWDLSRAKFQSGPAPSSGFYVSILIDGQMALLVGDAIPRATANNSPPAAEVMKQQQVMFLRREHVYGNKQMLYTTKSDFGVAGGAEREITIDCRLGLDDPRLYLSVEKKRVLQIKHLKWKFRGNERIQVDGIPIQVSWDVHSWLFQKQRDDVEGEGYALFMFKFENPWASAGLRLEELEKGNQQQTTCGFGFETKKMKKGIKKLRSGRGSNHSSSSSSSSSLSSASSGCSSVMEWESVEENELKDPSGSSLVVYAWKS